MSNKKMALLVSALAALVSFAAPAVSQAHYTWSSSGTLVLAGVLQASVEGIFVKSGPCDIELEVEVFNGAEAAEGNIVGSEVETPCGTPPEALCFIEEFHFDNLPWQVNTTTSHPREIEIENATFTHTNSTGCVHAGIPKEPSWAGTLSGTFDTNTQCITFSNAGPLKGENILFFNMLLNGVVCRLSGPTLH